MFFEAVLLGLVEGLTEFIPVSSTGHMIMLGDLLGFQGPPGKVFEVVIQLGAILAVCIAYFARLWRVVATLGGDPGARRFAAAIILGFLPSAFLGVLLHGFIKNVLFDPVVVCVALILGGIAILMIERAVPVARHDQVEDFPISLSLRIGLFQCLALVPGVSRSGASIMGALLMGVERKAAAEFSFFVAIPTMLGAATYDLFKNRDTLSTDGIALIAVGFAAAFLTGFVVVKAVVGFVSRHGFAPFAWYRIVLGALMLAWFTLAR
ncbi:MAG TPA: undecaprenyl-diphosphate phosphatase [Azospirillaceae bacterium]|nr:undecaprenyl-diphosphate phosphatase [Azospirillaceae bacterium]